MFNRTTDFGLRRWFTAATMVLFMSNPSFAQDAEMFEIDLPGGDTVEIRLYKSEEGNRLLLGFACDEGTGVAEMNTASILSNSSIEIWMPDLLSAHLLPKLNSSLDEIPGEDVVTLIDAAIKASDKKVYLISSGPGSKLLMRGLALWEQQNPQNLDLISGVILLYPRLNAAPPEPGQEPVFIDEVGKTTTAMAIMEGEKTPNRWFLESLKEKMQASGAVVTTSIIPGVRGHFYKRDEQNFSEDLVTTQLAGLVRATVVKLEMLKKK